MGNWTLRAKLVSGVGIVIVLAMAALGLVFVSLLSNLDRELLQAIKDRVAANAKLLASDVGYDISAGLKDDATAKLAGFMGVHQEAHGIVVLDKQRELFASAGAKVDARKHLDGFGTFKDVKRRVKGDLVVAAALCEDEGNAFGYVVYVESLAEYRAARARLIWLGMGALFGGLVIVLISVFLIGSRTARPISRLIKAAGRIADGDLREIEIELDGGAEIQRLGESIRRMAEALQKQVTAIKRLTADVSRVSREVAQAMSHLASSATEQAAAVAETASTVEEMEKAGKSAASNAKQIVEAAEKTTEASIRGRQAVDTTSQIILHIKEDSKEISSKSKDLLSNVEEIGNVISSVNAIAEQSKILAVNASIEAAKAGEYGVGFAVVAQEVKDLAQQSKEATLQITGTLTAIRQAIENMVTTASSGETRTEDGVKMIGNAGAIVNDLSEAIRENSDVANVINTSVGQQTVGLTQIATAIEQINAGALENQEISRKIEEGTRQMTDSMERLTNLVGRWKTPAQDS